VKAKVPSNSRVFPFAMGALLLEASRTRPSTVAVSPRPVTQRGSGLLASERRLSLPHAPPKGAPGVFPSFFSPSTGQAASALHLPAANWAQTHHARRETPRMSDLR